MTDYVHTKVVNDIGFITLDRPQVLNSLSLEMIRAITQTLSLWKNDAGVRAVVIRSSSERALCAGADIRFFYEAGQSTAQHGGALIEDFFTEEYALNHLVHHYPKPYIAIMDGIVMGGGMGICQTGTPQRMRVVTERTKMAMPEVNIGFFPDVGGTHFLSRTPGQCGAYLAVTGQAIGAADALYAGLADVFVPASQLSELVILLKSTTAANINDAVREFAAPFQKEASPARSMLASNQALIDRHFAHDNVLTIRSSLNRDDSAFAQATLKLMQKASPLMMCVALEQIRRGASLGIADCLRMERGMVRRSFEYGEVLEGVRALAIDKDKSPRWNPSKLEAVAQEMVTGFFNSPWPHDAHPLRGLGESLPAAAGSAQAISGMCAQFAVSSQ